MKAVVLVLAVLILGILYPFNAKGIEPLEEGELSKKVNSYILENEINVLSKNKEDNIYILLYEDGYDYGLLKLYLDDFSNLLVVSDERLYNSSDNSTIYSEISYDKQYLLIYITDKDLKDKVDSIKIIFDKTADTIEGNTYGPYAIQQTVSGMNPTIISYTNYDKRKSIKKVIFLNINSNEVYSLKF